MKRTLMAALALATAFAAGCLVFGWWSAALIGAIGGWWLARTGHRPVLTTAAAGAVGWGAILTWSALAGEIGRLLEALGNLFGVPAAVFPLATLLVAAGLSALGAWAGTSARPAAPSASGVRDTASV